MLSKGLSRVSSNTTVQKHQFFSAQLSLWSNSLQPHGLQHARLPITNSWSLFKLMFIELVMPSNNLILCHLLLLTTSIFPSNRVFSNESVHRIRWPKYWSFSFSISPSSESSGLFSFRMDWLDLLAVQGTLKSLLQHHSSKASILQHSYHGLYRWVLNVIKISYRRKKAEISLQKRNRKWRLA